MKRVLVTPAGRRQYLPLLAAHLEAQKEAFDEWHLWMNTNVQLDQECIRDLASKHPWVTVVTHPDSDPSVGSGNIHKLYVGCTDSDTVYMKLDDDVVWLEPGFLERTFAFRQANPQYFLVCANIINNAVISHIHERSGRIHSEQGRAGYLCMCPVAWKNPDFAKDLHLAFLKAIREGTVDEWHFGVWKLYDYERVSINCILWMGKEFAEFGGIVGHDDEQWLACDKPRELGRMNAIFGGACCVHYAFFTQRPGLDATDILAQYDSVTPQQ